MKIKLTDKNHDFFIEATAQYLEKVMQHFGHDHTIEDVEWQVIYDLKEHLLEALEGLGFTIERVEDDVAMPLSYYVKEVSKERMELSDVPLQHREAVEKALEKIDKFIVYFQENQ